LALPATFAVLTRNNIKKDSRYHFSFRVRKRRRVNKGEGDIRCKKNTWVFQLLWVLRLSRRTLSHSLR
jgi:hypothetical protein